MSGSLPIFADWNDAISGVVHALGGFKKVGVMLRPELADKPLYAAQWLRDCLNQEKPERLNPDQVFMLLRLARQANYHAAKHWMDAELGYEQGRPLSPQDELAQLTARAADIARDFRATVERMERLSQPALSSVKAA